MCVKQSGDGIVEGIMTAETFEALTPAFPYLDALVLNGVGESLLHPELESFIARAKALLSEHAWVGFQTNGMALSDQRAKSLVEAGLDRICLSFDTVSDESFRAIRNGGSMRGIESAFTDLNRARGRHGGHRLRTGIEFVLMRDNLTELPEAVRWAGRLGADFVIVTQLLPYHKDLVAQTAYDTNTADAIAIYEHWKARAQEDGADIRRYFDVFMKFSKTAEEERIVGYVNHMRNDAHARGITLHTERLLRRDDEWFDTVHRVFDEAARLAREEDIELTLPHEAHGYSGRESIEHVLYEMISWFDKYVKNAPSRTKEQRAEN